MVVVFNSTSLPLQYMANYSLVQTLALDKDMYSTRHPRDLPASRTLVAVPQAVKLPSTSHSIQILQAN